MRPKRAMLIGAVVLVAGAAGMPMPSTRVPAPAPEQPLATPEAGLVGALHDVLPAAVGAPVPTTAATPDEAILATITGSASYYANSLAGRPTASGKLYDPTELIAAHRDYPFGTRLRVTNLRNDRSVEVRVIDRGPFVRDRVLDLSRAAAERLGFISRGLAEVRIEVLEWGDARD